MSYAILKTYSAAQSGQEEFARLSGDWNPIHMDPVLARRSQVGRPVAHGIHTLLLVLDAVAASSRGSLIPSKLTVSFAAPVYIGDRVEILRFEPEDGAIRARGRVSGTTVLDVRIQMSNGAAPSRLRGLPSVRTDRSRVCRNLSIAEMPGRTGMVNPARQLRAIAARFPKVSKWIGAQRVAGLMCVSRLVGTECPGLHSILLGMTLEFVAESATGPLIYRVESAHEQLRVAKVAISGFGLRGQVQALAARPPVSQARLDELSPLVAQDEFADQRVLIIGGSRGLGELTAKLIAGGGGQVTVTHAAGRTDADTVAGEIRNAGGECDVVRFDVRRAAPKQLHKIKRPITSVYYFATPHIFGRRSKEFSEIDFQSFLGFYARGFYELCSALSTTQREPITAFYPSSVAVDNRPPSMAEYTTAKAIGEILCAKIGEFLPGVRVCVERLPRLRTDQTSNTSSAALGDSVETMLRIIRSVQNPASPEVQVAGEFEREGLRKPKE
jgi:acyl dehydratase/NAD(P)-dependent dehydrogenase (short-subunit alcohol dehydrogenase family)